MIMCVVTWSLSLVVGMYILYISIIEINCAHSIRNRAGGSRILFDNEPKKINVCAQVFGLGIRITVIWSYIIVLYVPL